MAFRKGSWARLRGSRPIHEDKAVIALVGVICSLSRFSQQRPENETASERSHKEHPYNGQQRLKSRALSAAEADRCAASPRRPSLRRQTRLGPEDSRSRDPFPGAGWTRLRDFCRQSHLPARDSRGWAQEEPSPVLETGVCAQGSGRRSGSLRFVSVMCRIAYWLRRASNTRRVILALDKRALHT